MNLSHPWILHFLWVVPLTFLLLIVSSRRRAQALTRFADPPLLERLVGEMKKERQVLRSACLLAAMGFMVLAWAGPRWGSHYQEVRRKGVDMIIALDVSRSMLVEDVAPNRIERAKREISDLIRVLEGDRVGLVAFAGAAFTHCPLTLDYGAMTLFLTSLTPDMAPSPGTDLGAAIDHAISSFDPASETDKVILLITDGEDNEGRGLEAARKAARKGIKIFVFGIGDPSGGPIPSADGKGGFKKDNKGQLVLSRLDEEGLKEIAAATGGSYVRSVAGDLDLDLLYFDGIKQKTKAAELKSGKIKVYEERFPIFVMVAFFLLLLEGLIRPGGMGRNGVRPGAIGKRSTMRVNTLLFLLFLTGGPGVVSPALGAEDPDELYRKGRFAEAQKMYAQSDMDHPRELRFRYNRGCADYQAGDYKGAMAAFSSVLRRAEDRDIRFRAAYNLGNASLQLGDAASAAEYYRQALRITPDQEDARHNLEIALKRLEQQKKEKEEKEKDAAQNRGEGGGSQKDQEKGKSEEKPTSNKSPREGDHGKDAEQKEGEDQAKGTGQARDQRPDEGSKDLSGELRPLEATPEEAEKAENGPPPVSTMDRRKAEALLDNVMEDRSKFFQLQQPEGQQRGTASGKDW